MNKYCYIKTYGCQMNEHDSARMYTILKKQGYNATDKLKQADLIILNTCSVRANPENKVYSLLGRIRPLKEKNKDIIVGVAGCVAQQQGENILKKMRIVDMVFGPDHFFELPEILEKAKKGERIVATTQEKPTGKTQNFIPEHELKCGQVNEDKACIAITKGCDNFCSFCIVPLTRGRETSRDLNNILTEAKDLVAKGAKEITLLGQNVNSYQGDGIGFYELLEQVANIPGLTQVKFMSPHPKDWNNKLSDLLTKHPVICNQLHLPFQSGSNEVLKKMNRFHTIEQYLEKIDYLKSINPDVVLSTDVIVGFPGETKKNFQKTLDVLKHVRFKQIFAFKYSARPGTKAAELQDDVPLKEKEDRLARLQECQRAVYGGYLSSPPC